MQAEDCFQLGYIGRAHGIKGEVKAFFDVIYIEEYKDKETIYLSNKGKLSPFFILKMNILDHREVIMKFRGIDNRSDAEGLRGSGLFLPLEDLPELEEGQFYYHEILGFTVEDKNLGVLGTILRVEEMPAQDLIVMDYNASEVLIPVTGGIVLRADLDKQIVYTLLPEGLLEVYQKTEKPSED